MSDCGCDVPGFNNPGQLPVVTTADNGDVLEVVGGVWAKATAAPGTLPVVGAADNGDNLSVVGGVWAKAANGFRSVATIAARNALTATGIVTAGMLAYVTTTQCLYQLNNDLATWSFFAPSPALAAQAVWEINAATGSDNNDGLTAGTALATSEEWSRRVHSEDKYIPTNALTTVHFAAGAYGLLYLNVQFPNVGGNFSNFIQINCDFTASAPITLSAVVDTNATVARGQVTTVGALGFTANARISSTSGAAAGAMTYSTGQNANAKNHFVKEWWNYNTGAIATVAAGTTCTVDTLTTSFAQLNWTVEGVTGFVELHNAALSNPLNLQSHTVTGAINLVGCSYTGDPVGQLGTVYGSPIFENCNFISGNVEFSQQFPDLFGCIVQSGATLSVFPCCQLAFFSGNCINGGHVVATEGAFLWGGANVEFCNGGAGVAIDIQSASAVTIVGGLWWGLSTNYDVAVRMQSLCRLSTPLSTSISIPATIQLQMSSHTPLLYTDVPISFDRAGCVWTISPDSNSTPSPVTTGAVAFAANVGTTQLLVTGRSGQYRADINIVATTLATAAPTCALNIVGHDAAGAYTAPVPLDAGLTGTIGSSFNLGTTSRAAGSLTFEHDGTTAISFTITGITTPGPLAATYQITLTKVG